MPASTLQINLDKTYNIVLFKGLSNGEYINNMKGLGGPVILYRCAGNTLSRIFAEPNPFNHAIAR